MSKFTKTIAGFAGSIALIASLAGSAGAATFSTNLTVGSSGPAVSDLQSFLVAGGYLTMPPGVAMGYFGSLTKAAVIAFQKAKGITPAVGYFGPITQGFANAAGGTVGGGSSIPGCGAGAMYSSVTGAPCASAGSTVPGCSAGAMYSSTTGAPCAGGTVGTGSASDGKDGSATITYDPYAPSSQSLKKGDMGKAVIAVKVSAASGNVSINRLDVEFSDRPWLYFSKITLKDTAGNTIATKMLSSSADADEITVGSDYKVRFDGVNYLVTPDADKTLVAYLDVLPASDKFPATVYVGIPSGNIRSINGKGYTDSLGISSGTGSCITSGCTTPVTITLSSTGSTASIYTKISSATPDTRIVVSNNTSVTPDVVLGVFGIKSTNQNSTLNSLSFNINTGTSTTSYATTSLVSNVRLKVGSQVYGANSLAAGASTFTNLNIALPVEQWTDVTLLADINSGYNSNNITASSTLVAASMVGVDTNFNSLTLSSASNVTSNNITFLQAGVTLSSASATLGQPISGILAGTTAGTVGYNTRYVFTLTNSGNTDVYVSRAPGAFLATTTVLASAAAANTASSSISNLTVSSTLPGDSVSSSAYVVPTGNSRTFTFDGILKSGTGGGLSSQTITGVYFNTTAANVTSTSTANAITFGLNALTLNAGF